MSQSRMMWTTDVHVCLLLSVCLATHCLSRKVTVKLQWCGCITFSIYIFVSQTLRTGEDTSSTVINPVQKVSCSICKEGFFSHQKSRRQAAGQEKAIRYILFSFVSQAPGVHVPKQKCLWRCSPHDICPQCNWSLLWNTAGCHYETWLLSDTEETPRRRPRHQHQQPWQGPGSRVRREFKYKPEHNCAWANYSCPGRNHNKLDTNVNLSVALRFTDTRAERQWARWQSVI